MSEIIVLKKYYRNVYKMEANINLINIYGIKYMGVHDYKP